MTKSKDLMIVAGQTEQNIKTLEELKEELKFVETPQLVSGYLMVKDFATRVKKFTETVREELLFDSPDSVEEKLFDGRFFMGNAVVDDKGHHYLDGEDGKQLKAEKRVRSNLNQKKAKEVLKEKGEYGAAIDKRVVGADVSILDKLESLKKELVLVGMEKYVENIDEVLGNLNVVESLNEEKIKALVSLEVISVKDVENMYDVNVTYALKEQKKKK